MLVTIEMRKKHSTRMVFRRKPCVDNNNSSHDLVMSVHHVKVKIDVHVYQENCNIWHRSGPM